MESIGKSRDSVLTSTLICILRVSEGEDGLARLNRGDERRAPAGAGKHRSDGAVESRGRWLAAPGEPAAVSDGPGSDGRGSGGCLLRPSRCASALLCSNLAHLLFVFSLIYLRQAPDNVP